VEHLRTLDHAQPERPLLPRYLARGFDAIGGVDEVVSEDLGRVHEAKEFAGDFNRGVSGEGDCGWSLGVLGGLGEEIVNFNAVFAEDDHECLKKSR
jgi:hypothetical protein